MIDSHTHLYCNDFDADRAEVVLRARKAGVTHVVLPNENLESIPQIHAMQDAYPDYCSVAMGLHPEDVNDSWSDALDVIEPLFTGERHYVGVGEIGMDLYWDATYREQQMQALERQLTWCVKFNLPFVIHCRNALSECLEVLQGFKGQMPRGVFHSFTGSEQDLELIRKTGDFYFGINGIVTFKKSTLPAVLPAIGLDRLLLETDSPFLAPVPNRGKRNESANIPYICQKVADSLALTAQQVSDATDRNARALFTLPK